MLLTKSGHFTGPAPGLRRVRSHFESGKMALFSTYYEFNLNFARKSIHYAAALAGPGSCHRARKPWRRKRDFLAFTEPWLLLAWPPSLCVCSCEAPGRVTRLRLATPVRVSSPGQDMILILRARAPVRVSSSPGSIQGQWTGLLPSLPNHCP